MPERDKMLEPANTMDFSGNFLIWTQPLCKGVSSVMTGFRLHPYIRPL